MSRRIAKDSTLKARIIALSLLAIVFGIAPGVLAALGSGYYFQIAATCLVFIILAVSMNMITGVCGLLSLGHAAFYGIGAYTAAILADRLGAPFLITLPAAGIVASFAGFLVALPTMRLISIYFAVATLGIGEMIYVTLLNWVSLTRGPMGISVFEPLSVFGFEFTTQLETYYLVAVITTLCVYAVHRLTHSYYGNAMRSVREDDQCAEAMGVNVTRVKIQVFAASTFFAGVAGAITTHTAGYISPDYFRFSESILILAMVVVGGLGSVPGAVVGALLLIILPEAARGLGDYRMFAVGMVMFLSILLLPKGLFGEISAVSLVRKHLGTAWRSGGQRVGWR